MRGRWIPSVLVLLSLIASGLSGGDPAGGRTDGGEAAVELKHARAGEIVETLERVLAPWVGGDGGVSLEADESKNAIVVGGNREWVEAVRWAIAELDVAPPGDGKSVTVEVTVFDVRMPVGDVGKLDVKDLREAAASDEGLLAALGRFGEASQLQRLSQRVAVGRETKLSYVWPEPKTTSQTWQEKMEEDTREGKMKGEVFVWPQVGGTRGDTIRMGGKLKKLTRTNIELGKSMHAPASNVVCQNYDGPIVIGQPVVAVGTCPSADGELLGYVSVVRVVVSDLR